MELSDSIKYLQEYLEENSTKEDEVLHDLRRYTYLKVIHPRMLSGPLLGKFLEMVSGLIRPEKILEIGTYTGYSAICLARGLKPGGELFTIDINDELQEKTRTFFDRAGLTDRIRCITGNAIEIIPTLEDEFDLVFIDGEKEEYIDYYNCVFPRLKTGGIILADNVLWDGKVMEPEEKMDSATRSIYDFNRMISADSRVENVILPLRDGINLIRKK